ncbi:MAG: glucoamylase family protein [Bacteroidales bacterium]
MAKNNIRFFIISLLIVFSMSGCSERKSGQPAAGVLTDDSLLTLVQKKTFMYFWDGAEPVSGMARERYHVDGNYPENDFDVVTSGGSGFGIMALIAGMERGFVARSEGIARLQVIMNFLEKADRFHGAYPHWMHGPTGKVKPFSPKDNGADLVETAYLMQGLLALREYLSGGDDVEKSIASRADKLWRDVEWDWFTKNGENVIYWHWSPDYEWAMNFPVRGYNECLIMYVLAASSPTHPVSPAAYHEGWARNGAIDTITGKYGYVLKLHHNGAPEYGGPLFWSHYSFLGLDPRKLRDKYADYWEHNTNHTLINWKWCSENTLGFKGYSSENWGLTASYSVDGYAAHAPGKNNDLGVISPTAAISSIVYTPRQSLDAIRYFYNNLGDRIFGKYGFYDAFSEEKNWFPARYLAIDQGPEVIMIENYRTGLLWNLFMQCPEIRSGLDKLGFTY